LTHLAADPIAAIAMNALCSMIRECESNKAIVGPIGRARGERVGEQGFMLVRSRWGQSRRDAVLPVRSSGCR